MALLDWLTPIGSALSGLGGFIGNFGTKRAQNRQNEFNAAQADLNRQFQSQEAEIARDWQEQQYNQYSSPSAMVRQYQEAGLNPALMYGQNLQGSIGSSPMPSGSAASGSALSRHNPLSGIAESIIGLAKLKQDIAESKSRENANYAAAFNSERSGLAQNAAAALAYQQIRFSKKEMFQIDENIEFLRQRSVSEVQQRNLRVLEMAFHKANNKQIDLKNAISDEFERFTGYKADAQTINAILFSASNVLGGFSDIVGSTFTGLTSFLKPKPGPGKLKIPKLSEVTGNVK